jgi:hypothetical protein
MLASLSNTTQVSGYRFTRNDTGMRLDGAGGQIDEGNRFARNEVGIQVADPVFDPSVHSTVNRFDDNTLVRSGISAMLLLDPLGSEVTISNNTARRGGNSAPSNAAGDCTPGIAC